MHGPRLLEQPAFSINFDPTPSPAGPVGRNAGRGNYPPPNADRSFHICRGPCNPVNYRRGDSTRDIRSNHHNGRFRALQPGDYVFAASLGVLTETGCIASHPRA